MQEFPEEEVEETVTDPSAAVEFGLSRRDLIKAATLLTGSMVLMLSRCRPLEEMGTDLPPVPADFKRFVLAEQSPIAPAEETDCCPGIAVSRPHLCAVVG